jgi:CHAT domain-containing protein
MLLLPILFSHSQPLPLSQFTQHFSLQASLQRSIDLPDLIQQGKVLYDRGQYGEAILVLQQVVQRGDRLQQAVALGNLSLTYQQLGQWEAAQQAVEQSLKLLREEGGESSSAQRNILAQTLDVQGQLQLSLGQPQAALETWQQTATIYRQSKNSPGETRSQINQAQALQALGLYRQAFNTLSELNQSLQSQPDSVTKAVALRSLGDALQVVGDLDQSQQVLTQSLAIAQSQQSAQAMSNASLSLGNTTRAQAALLTASADAAPQVTRLVATTLQHYEQAATTAPDALTQIQAQLNQVSLLIQYDRFSEAQALITQIQPKLDQLPPSRATIYAQVNLAESLVKQVEKETEKTDLPSRSTPLPSPSLKGAAQLLAKAAQQGKQLGDKRAESYALGSLAALYEKTGQWQEAQPLTEQALVLAQAIAAPEITYRWQWQLGRILKAQQQIPQAIAAYDAAVATLQSIRGDLIAANRDVQFSFRESVEPVYRESVALLLQSEAELSEATLDKARQRIETLQLAELDNFFREACINAQTVAIDEVVDQENPDAAIIYPIILEDRLEIIVKLPQQPLNHYTIKQSEAEIERIAEEIRTSIVQPDRLQRTRTLTQEVYGWLVEPIEAQLEQSKVNTLVFVLDGALRNVPIAALYDGDQYLVEKYAVSLSLGLQLFDPKPLARTQLKALAAGLIQPPPEFAQFPPLPEIRSEFQLIEATGLPIVELLDFTSKALQQEINAAPFNVVHLATHGQFSSQAKDTFILAADGPINVNELDNLLRSRDQTRTEAIELLVLSACQTAAGDNRATLGLAGVAVRAGARSTLASLWQIDDRATALFIGEFYRALANPKLTKAEALRQAQLNLRQNYPDYDDPSYWAAYILVGNWL